MRFDALKVFGPIYLVKSVTLVAEMTRQPTAYKFPSVSAVGVISTEFQEDFVSAAIDPDHTFVAPFTALVMS